MTLETLTQRNAEHARRVAARPRGETVADLKAGSARTSEFIRSLTDEQLELTQEFAWAGTQNVGWVASGSYPCRILGDPRPKRRTRYNQPFVSASFAASDRFLQPNFWIAFER